MYPKFSLMNILVFAILGSNGLKREGKIANRMKSNSLIANDRLISPLTWNGEQKWHPSGRTTEFCFKSSFH